MLDKEKTAGWPVGYRPQFLQGNVLLGREITLKLPNGETPKGQFAVVELNDLLASHNEETYSSTEGYPLDHAGENINDRNYKDDQNAQAKVREFAQNLEPDRLITTSRTPSGTPVVSIDGVVISGNNRTMSIKLAVKEFPGKYLEYLDFLSDEIEAFGFKHPFNYWAGLGKEGERIFENKAKVTDLSGKEMFFKNPVLVRIDYDVMEYNTMELSKWNKDTKKAERPIDKAIKLGKMLKGSDRCTNVINEIVGRYETFTEFYSNIADQKQLKETLINCNILTSQEIPAYFTERGFTEQGKELIENLLAGMVLSKDALVSTSEGGAKTFRQTIITSLPVLIANLGLGSDSLNDYINEAVLIQAQMSASKLSFKDFLHQENIFGEKPSEKALYMNRLFASGRNKFKGSIEAYNNSVVENQGENLFGDKPTQDEIFEAHIVETIDPDDRALIKRKYSAGLSPKFEQLINNAPLTIKIKTEEEAKESDKKLSQVLTEKINNVIKPTMQQNPYINGNFFVDYPEKILAEKGTTRTKFGGEVTTYKGSLEDVERIPVDVNFLMSDTQSNPLVSSVGEPVSKATDENVVVYDNLVNALDEGVKNETKKRSRKKQLKETLVTKMVTGTETLTLTEVYNAPGMNAEISETELQVYLWYRNNVGRPITNPEWFEIANISENELYHTSELVKNWIENGELFYFDGSLLPKYLYLAENIYEKHNRLLETDESPGSGQDKDVIIEKYGQVVYDKQIKAFDSVFKQKSDTQLRIKGEPKEGEAKEGLILLPISKLARSFMIKTFADEIEFKWWKVDRKADKFYGKMDIFKREKKNYRDEKIVFSELSLTDAFLYWLITDETIPFKKGNNYLDIITVYIFAKQRSGEYAKARTNSNGEFVGAELELHKKEVEAWERLKSKTKTEGDRLFSIFLDAQLTTSDKTRLEYQWNRTYNGYVPINYQKVPVAFRMNKFIDGAPAVVEPEKREAVAFTFSNGSGLIAYDVGVGKTPSAVFTIAQFIDSGYAQKPVLIVPNQTYKQWISEFKKFANHISVNSFFNLTGDWLQDWIDDKGAVREVQPGSVSLMTEEAMKVIGFNEPTIQAMKPEIEDILLQHSPAEIEANKSDKKREREQEALNNKVEEMIGKALSKTVISIEDLGFDFILIDEAHSCKKIFTRVQGEAEETGPLVDGVAPVKAKKENVKTRYELQSGSPSFTGIKGFMLCQYIQRTFGGNTMLLTATPFTNSPLEIYSMLSMIAYHKLKEMQLANLNTFFDNYVSVSYEMIINSRLRPQRKQVILGFNNILSLQQLIKRFINYKTGDQVPSVVKKRPQKIVLPMLYKDINGIKTELNDQEKVNTILPLTPLQAELMAKIKAYANGEIDDVALCSTPQLEEEDDHKSETAKVMEVDVKYLSKKDKQAVIILKSLSHARNLALSPYIFECSGLGKPTPEQYINTSNKLSYVMECIKSMKKYHADHKEAMSGVIIYMDRGKEYMPLIKTYLVENLGFEPNEIGIMASGLIGPTPKEVKEDGKKDYVKNSFLGIRYNEATMDFEDLPDDQRIKIIIGSSMIREGINLQSHTSTMFNCWLDWNPSDLQQLYGRCYRQGNKFKTVRLVVPLMIDSMDSFIFQKLGEKTSRINSIWEGDGRTNVFDTTEFNPSETKYVLIKDTKVLAEMELMEKSERMEDEIVDEENKIKRNKRIIQYDKIIKDHSEELEKWLEEYRPSNGRKRSIESVIGLSQEVLRKQLDSEGKPMVRSWQQDEKKQNKGFYSDLEPADKPGYGWYDEIVYAVRNLKREVRDYLEPNKLSIGTLNKYNEKILKEIEAMQKKKTDVAGPEAIKKRAQELTAERIKSKVKDRDVPEVVNDFKKLNYLLSEVKVPQIKIEVTTCPPVDEKGVVRIDREGIAMLDKCISTQTQTKALHTIVGPDEQLVYTPERQALHKKILSEVTGKTICTDQIQPIAVLTGGAPGSGKSTFLRKFAPYLQAEQIYKIDADEIREGLPEYEGWNSASTHQETRDMVNELLNSFDKPCKHDLLYDGTMSNAQKYIPLIEKLKGLGYKVYVAYMDVPKEVSIQRAMKRYQDNHGGKTKFGRYVPLDVIEDFFKTGKAGFDEIKRKADGYILVDSLTQEIKEIGGEPIPQNRDYKVMFEHQTATGTTKVETATGEPTKADFEASIKGTKVAIKYAEGQDKKDLQTYLKGLEVTIKYL